tara:strand:- start:771 stop:1154 length:384 start_codon:yes stop_codon:yes gene_type:complete
MDRIIIKETVEAMLLTSPYEDRFPEPIVTLLEDNYEDCWKPKKQSHNHPQIEQFEDQQYFGNTGISYFISWLAKAHEGKIKNMSAKSKATLLAIVCRTSNPESIKLIHRIIARDALDYVNKHGRSHD